MANKENINAVVNLLDRSIYELISDENRLIVRERGKRQELEIVVHTKPYTYTADSIAEKIEEGARNGIRVANVFSRKLLHLKEGWGATGNHQYNRIHLADLGLEFEVMRQQGHETVAYLDSTNRDTPLTIVRFEQPARPGRVVPVEVSRPSKIRFDLYGKAATVAAMAQQEI